ncbi:hypothetical protein PAXRUDRAFT_823086 [Paxillus rubicundulus Ve08.2h10]|uniref:Uncharacterized protein n=1 Tax=Paxillus rubicundulus Ve08.2h10 TaxID=930991 RepID=A0A0D0ECC4_9AGAM|nr:hypothetical protein PAXRUDRAFT_823086 [Paxillus rubicundulus Ve08.2h10]
MPDSLSRLCLALFLLGTLTLRAFAQENVVLSSTNPDIIYNPPLCSPSSIGCLSPWQLSNDTQTGTTTVFTNGPIPEAGNVIPQMFLSFRASMLYLRTSSLANASINFTLTVEPGDVSITAQLNTSIRLVEVVNLPETQTTTLGITFLVGALPTRFDVESITLAVANASATSSFLPLPSLPFSSSPPTLVPLPTATQSSATSDKKATIIGATLGAVLGTLLIAIACFVIYRRNRRARTRAYSAPRGRGASR